MRIVLQVVDDCVKAKSIVGAKALLPTMEWTWPDTLPGERIGSRRWIETGMPEPRTKYGPFCARVGTASVAKRVRREERLERIFFSRRLVYFFNFFWNSLRYQIPTSFPFFLTTKRGDVEMKILCKRKVQKKRVGSCFLFS